MTTLLVGVLSRPNLTLLQQSTITDSDLVAVLNRCATLRLGKEADAFLLRHFEAATCHSLTSLTKL